MNRPNGKFINSVIKDSPAEQPKVAVKEEAKPVEKSKTNNKRKQKKDNEMNTNEQLQQAAEIMDMMAPEVKVVKKDRGLIERTESSKIILTEDNRQVLND